LRGRILGPRQLLPLLLAVEGLRQDIVRAGDDLQRLAQIVTGDRQQRRREVAVGLVCIAALGTTDAARVPAGAQRGSDGIEKTDFPVAASSRQRSADLPHREL
jgi:hypothetical protein